jgi:hypothetical protein
LQTVSQNGANSGSLGKGPAILRGLFCMNHERGMCRSNLFIQKFKDFKQIKNLA